MPKRVRPRPREEVIAELRGLYNDRYDLTTVRYEKASGLVTITCPTHGDFSKSMQAHRNGYGCQRCAGRRKYDLKIAERAQAFEGRAREVHGDRYTYEKAIYTGAQNCLIVTCPTHGPFEVTAHHHVSPTHKQGCPYCSGSCTCDKDFKERIARIHGDTITIDHIIDVRKRVTATCHRCNRVWRPWPKGLVEGHGCPICSRSTNKGGFNMMKPGTLYLIKFLVRKREEVFKLGITNRTPKKRVWGLGLSRGVTYEVLATEEFDLGVEAYDEEQRLLEIMSGYIYMGEPFMTNGRTELFIIDPRIITQCFTPEL